MILANLTVTGRARTKGSLKPVRTGAGSFYMKEQVAQSRPWRAKVARASREYQLAEFGALRRYEGAVEVRAVFFLPREESVSGGPFPSHDTLWPTAITIGDGDKLLRNVNDALIMPRKRSEAAVTSALILDDSQIVKQSGLKVWVGDGEEPRARILVIAAVTPELSLAEEARAWGVMGVAL